MDLAWLIAAGVHPTQARIFIGPLTEACVRFDILSPVRQGAFFAQVAHESAMFTRLEESLYYRSPERIVAIFSAARNIAEAMPLVRNPRGLANRVYANRNGNGDTASGDGWKYRGRGLIQLTGRHNYSDAGIELDRPYEQSPELVAEPADACMTAAWFWNSRRCNYLADASAIDAITRAVNGSAMTGAGDRRHLFEVAMRAFLQPATA